MGSEADGLLVELVEVLVVDTLFLELINLGGLDVPDLLSLCLDLLANLAALLQVVESLLLLEVVIDRDLGANLLRVVHKCLLL